MMTKDEALRILLGGKHYNSVEECQAELAEIAGMIEGMTEVVRCKDCEYGDVMKYCPVVGKWVYDDFYCAEGERKDGEQDAYK